MLEAAGLVWNLRQPKREVLARRRLEGRARLEAEDELAD